MNILITGGLGYVGTALIPTLYKQKSVNKIVVYDNLANHQYGLFLLKENLSSKVMFEQGNILNNQFIKEVFAKHNIEQVIHLAAKTITPMNDGGFHEFDQVNHWGTSILVDAIKSVDSVKKIIFLSSFSVYGTYKKKFDENNVPMPVSNYGKSKLLAEREILERLPSSIEKIILRSGVLFGFTNGFKPTTVLNKYIFEAHFLRKLQVFGNGNQKRPFLHINRMAEIISKIATSNTLEHHIYNVSDYTLSINELTDSFRQLYPDLNLIYMNRDHEMKSIEMESIHKLDEKLKLVEANSIKYYLDADKRNFSF
jgi:UDP-glucose 4-epimerase